MFSNTHSVLLLDLPGFGKSPFESDWNSVEELAVPLTLLINDLGFTDVILVGWSLGAAIALRMASVWVSRPSALRGLVTIGASPSYVNKDFAINETIYKKTIRNLKNRYPKSFTTILPLLLGEVDYKGEIPSQKALIHSLELFYKENLINILPDIMTPTLIIHGDQDQVFSQKAAAVLKSLLRHSELMLFSKAGHAPFLSQKESFYSAVIKFYKKTVCKDIKNNLKLSFSKAYETYDNEANYQKKAGRRLIELFPEKVKKCSVLDIGTGTGFLPINLIQVNSNLRVVGCDISFHMLKYASARAKETEFCASDAEFLPFKDASFDWAVSSMMYHWVNPLNRSFNEVFRVLNDGGKFLFSIAAQGTLAELKDAYIRTMSSHYPQASKKDFHFFPSQNIIKKALSEAGFYVDSVRTDSMRVSYSSILDMLRSFRILGVSNPMPPSGGGLLGKNFIERLTSYYPASMKQDGKILGRYEILYFFCKTTEVK